MLLPAAASALVIKRNPERGNDDLCGNDDAKNDDAGAAHGDSRVADARLEGFAFVSALIFRVGHCQPPHVASVRFASRGDISESPANVRSSFKSEHR
jgi:hypothetical protein